MGRGIIYSIEMILVLVLLLYYTFSVMVSLKSLNPDVISKKNSEITLSTMLTSLLNSRFLEYVENYDLDFVYFSLSRLIETYFSAFTMEVSYYDKIIINSNTNGTVYVMFFYPLPYIFGDPLTLSKTVEVLDSELNSQEIYIDRDWWVTYIYDSNFSKNKTSQFMFIFPRPNYTVDNCSFFAFDKYGIPLKINKVYVNKTVNNFPEIYINITNYYIPEMFIVYRVENESTIKRLNYLCSRYSIGNINTNYVPASLDTNIFSWVTIYAKLNLKTGLNVFYVKYTYLPSYIFTYTNATLKNLASSNYEVYIPKTTYFYYFPDVSKLVTIIDKSTAKASDSLWAITGNSLVNLKVYAS